jgi:hypothetical protein
VLIAVTGVCPPAAGWRDKALGDEVADLPFCRGSQSCKLSNVHAHTFGQIICRKQNEELSAFDKNLVEIGQHLETCLFSKT